jgi:hypothetical protein
MRRTPAPSRWAAKQRAERSRGELSSEKAEALVALGFEWDEDEAEWLRWFIDLARWGRDHRNGPQTPAGLLLG